MGIMIHELHDVVGHTEPCTAVFLKNHHFVKWVVTHTHTHTQSLFGWVAHSLLCVVSAYLKITTININLVNIELECNASLSLLSSETLENTDI